MAPGRGRYNVLNEKFEELKLKKLKIKATRMKNEENGNVPLNVIWNWILPLEMSLCLEPFSTEISHGPLGNLF